MESVRRTAGSSLLNLMRELSSYERNEVAVELLRALEIEGHRFTEYIPKPLGKVLLFLELKEFDEIIDDLLIKVKTANPSVKTLVIKTLGTTLESFIQFGMRKVKLTEEEKVERIKNMLSVLLYGMADYEDLTVRASFTTIGKVLFASEVLTLESKNGRNEVAIGDVVGFLDRDLQQRSGQILRLNDKTVTLMCGKQQWRVAYALLHRVVDGSAASGELLELDLRHDTINSPRDE